VAEWFATAGDIATAYISNRRSDEPALFHRIIIFTKPDDEPSHIVYAAAGRDIWVVFASGPRTRVQRFQSLRAALNSVRPVLVEAGWEDMHSEASLS
jgi:hypothetical protein